MNDGYRLQLADLFKAVLSLSRETHVKQLEGLVVGASRGRAIGVPTAWIAPELSVEPLPTYYERRAQGYAFVRGVLERLGPVEHMHRLTPGGRVARSLAEELEEMSAIFNGAAAVAWEELGEKPAAAAGDAQRFREWAGTGDVAPDIRMMVPVFFDIARQKVKVWMILGWDTRYLGISFDTEPLVDIVRGHRRIRFTSTGRQVAYPVFAEVYMSRLLDRGEFRAHCDRFETRQGILEGLR